MILILSTFISSTGTCFPQAQREAHSRSSQGRRPSCCRMTYIDDDRDLSPLQLPERQVDSLLMMPPADSAPKAGRPTDH